MKFLTLSLAIVLILFGSSFAQAQEEPAFDRKEDAVAAVRKLQFVRDQGDRTSVDDRRNEADDADREDHRALRRWVAEEETDAQRVIRALLDEMFRDPKLASRVRAQVEGTRFR